MPAVVHIKKKKIHMSVQLFMPNNKNTAPINFFKLCAWRRGEEKEDVSLRLSA